MQVSSDVLLLPAVAAAGCSEHLVHISLYPTVHSGISPLQDISSKSVYTTTIDVTKLLHYSFFKLSCVDAPRIPSLFLFSISETQPASGSLSSSTIIFVSLISSLLLANTRCCSYVLHNGSIFDIVTK